MGRYTGTSHDDKMTEGEEITGRGAMNRILPGELVAALTGDAQLSRHWMIRRVLTASLFRWMLQ